MLQSLLNKFKHRPFPPNLQALRRCLVSYSQFGEDLYISTLFGGRKVTGTYVDVGCYSPIEFSNTYIFYQRGWHGLAIDPNPGWQREWQRYRPRDRFVNTAVSNKTGTSGYLMYELYPACNRLVTEQSAAVSLAEEPGDPKWGTPRLITVPTRPLTDIIAEVFPDAKIDLLNVDCEGHDLTILHTLDFSRYRPEVISAEDSSTRLDSPLCSFLQAKGYECLAYIGLTKVFRVKV